MKKHAAFLGIRLINDLGEPKTEDGIRREYARYAKANPSYFKETVKSEQIEISWLVRKAIADSLIEIGTVAAYLYSLIISLLVWLSQNILGITFIMKAQL